MEIHMKKPILTLILGLGFLLGAWAAEADSLSISRQEVSVTSTLEFLEAIAPGMTIYIEMNEIDPIIFTNDYPDAISEYCSFEYAYDGQQLVIHDLEGLTIIGPEQLRARLLSPYVYTSVIQFRNCKDISLQWLNCGHEVEGYCTGGVLAFENCHGVEINNCDLWGCGIEGLTIIESSGITCSQTTIRDCSYSIMSIYNSRDISFQDCLMHDNREFEQLNFTDSQQVRFSNCAIWNNSTSGYYSSNLISARRSEITFSQCAIFNNSVEALMNDDAGVSFENCTMLNNQYSVWHD